jgi:hypothetical protein
MCNERLSQTYVIESYEGARYSKGLRGADGEGGGGVEMFQALTHTPSPQATRCLKMLLAKLYHGIPKNG